MNNEIVKSDKGGVNSFEKADALTKINLAALSSSLGKLVVPRMFYQLVIFVMDGSRSMHDKSITGLSKGEEIDKNLKQTIDRLKESKNASSFDICLYAFSNDYKNVFGVKELNTITNDFSFNPYDIIQEPGETYLESTLLDVKNTIDIYFEDKKDKHHQALVLLLTDGEVDDSLKSLSVINEIKKNPRVTVSTMYLGNRIDENATYYSWDEATGSFDISHKWKIEDVMESEKMVAENLKKFASDESLFLTTINPEEIRKHMIKSISTVSKIM